MPTKSIFDLSAAHERLLVIAGLGYDPDTGEAFEPGDISKAFDELDEEAEAKILACGFVIKKLDSDFDALDVEIKRLARMRDVKRNGKARVIGLLRDFMDTTGLEKVKSPYLSVTLGKASKRVEVSGGLPRWWYTNPERVPDKAKIAASLKAGNSITGAKLVDGLRSVTIR